MENGNFVQRNAQFVGGDLRERSFLSLAVGRCTGIDFYSAVRLHLHLGELRKSRSHGAYLYISRKPDAEIFSPAPQPLLFAAEVGIAG